MPDTPEQILILLEKSAKAIVSLTDQLTVESAARTAHRHVLGSLLAKLEEPTVKALMDHLHEFIDGTEDVDGPVWASAYREELDSIYQAMTDARDLGN